MVDRLIERYNVSINAELDSTCVEFEASGELRDGAVSAKDATSLCL